MKVEIECNVKVNGATVEEAIARIAKELKVLQFNEADWKRIGRRYHQWERGKDRIFSDADWTPVRDGVLGDDGEIHTRASLTIRNKRW